MTMPGWSLVAALNSLQKAMIFTPCCPRAGPTGGAGLACPAGICNLISPTTFFAIKNSLLGLFDLPIFQFHRGIPAENIYRDFQFAALGLDFLDYAAEIEEWTIVDLHGFANFEMDFRTFVIFALGNLRLD